MITWKEFFDLRVNELNEAIPGTLAYPEKIKTSAIILSGHILVFVGAAAFIFKRKDVLS
jgi:ABC-type transport system involved in multi-copper enzyme maturation permease subunit